MAMMAARRGRAQDAAKHTNTAAALLAAGLPVAEAARQLARRHRLSERQARRYAERARDRGRVAVPAATVVFTVRVPEALVRRVRRHADRTRQTLSALVTRALGNFLDAAAADADRGP